MTAVPVPEIIGMNQDDAIAALVRQSLQGKAIQASGATVAKGTVTAVTPVAGTVVETGSIVRFEVSTGPTQVAVPFIVGMTRDGALAALAKAVLRGTPTLASSATIGKGIVIGVNPEVGTMVETNSAVNLEVSTGCARRGHRTTGDETQE